MLREPIGVQSFFTYEQTGQPPVSTEILDQNAKSYANQGPAIIAAEKVTLPSNFGTEYPTWGSQAAVNAVQNLPSLVQNIQNQPLIQAQRQVELNKAGQNLDYLTHLHDSGLYPYVAEMPGVKPFPVNSSPAAYNLGMNPLANPNALYQTQSQNFAGANTPPVTTNDQSGRQGGTGNQQGIQSRSQPAYQANPATLAPVAPAPTMSINAGSGGSPGTGAAPAASGPAISTFPNVAGSASSQPVSPSLSLASGNPYVTETSSPQPLDVPQRTHYSPQEALDWYKQNIGTNAVHARQEFDPSTGFPTNRNLVTLKDGSIQPIHSAFISANPGTGDWQSDPTTGNSTNPALAANPNAQALAQGMPQQAIIAQGTPLMASSDQQAGTRSDVPQYQNAPWLNRPSGMPASPTPTPTPQQALQQALPSAPTAKQQTYQPRSPEGDPTTNGYWMGHFGMSAQEFQQRMNDPKYAQVVGTGTPNASGIPSKKVQVTGLDGTKYNAYIDPGDGRPYVVQSPTLWSEHRDYLDGTSKDVNNAPTEEALKEMARVATKWGTYSGVWSQLTPAQMEAAARLGFAQENTTTNDGFSKNLQNQGTVINRAIELQNQLEGLTSTEDPDGSKARNWLAINGNATKQILNGVLPSLPGGLNNLVKPDPRITALKNSYQELQNAMREEESTRPLPPGQTTAVSNVNSVGNLWDADLQDQLNAFLARRGADLSRSIDTGLANKYRMSPSVVLQGNAAHFGNADTPGTSAKMPIILRNAEDKARAPSGAWVVSKSGLPYRLPAKAVPAN